ncbi:MAG: NUDIX hydrolase [Candidatus Shapirobacteria bacterium]|jgi:ADP-ribose pyrophosphatase YjhB (NUDIX family)
MEIKKVVEPIKSVTVVIFKGDEVLLVKNGDSSDHPTGVYGLPAGKVDEGETWEEAAIRECEEESGLKPTKLIKMPTFFEAELPRKDGLKKRFCCWSFYCPEYEGVLKSTDETEPLWVKIDEIGRLPMVVNVSQMITEAWEEKEKEKLREVVRQQSCGMAEF